ncbi:hypothetical protein F52700_11503 [Fusarium sp. NRRL 52700]|nr:hypothetical protein F52700_11503 [Fusarium sp. NRRL 52700]
MLDVISHAPERLAKALYIPKHDDTTSHFAIYDISKEYSEKVGVHPMGSESYKVELCLLRKPSGYHAGDNARFLVDVDASVSIHERVMGRDPLDAEVGSGDSYHRCSRQRGGGHAFGLLWPLYEGEFD